MSNIIRVVFADGHPAVCEGARSALCAFQMISVEDVAKTADEVNTILQRDDCDVLVTEYALPGSSATDGAEFLRSVRETFPAVRVVLQTVLDNPATIGAAIALGVSSVVSKRDDTANIASAILAAYLGGRYLSPGVLNAMHYVDPQSPFWRACQLSRCETKVLQLYMNGLSVSEIATHLQRSIKTVSTQKNSAMKKLGVGREFELYRCGATHGF
ncbi:MAG: response regulator [Janthinobacterium lividum]